MDAENQNLIPTRFKAKISHLLSYPIGAESISQALIDVPQFAVLALHFKQGGKPTHIQRSPFLRVHHSARYAAMAEKFRDADGVPLFNEWQIDIFPVLRVHRHQIKQHIVETVLPAVRQWLTERAVASRTSEESQIFFHNDLTNEFFIEAEEKIHPQRT